MSRSISFQGGTLVLFDVDAHEPVPVPFRLIKGRWRCEGYHYGPLQPELHARGLHDTVPRWQRLDLPLQETREPHAYQMEAVAAWEQAGQRGSIILPTGAGKTFVAIQAISRVNRSTLVVAPTIDLLHQWYARLVRTRGYLLCNPHNPTGRVFGRAELERIAALARRYDVIVVSDENHAPLTLPGAAHAPLVALGKQLLPQAATVISAAKAWNLTGLKCAVVVAGSDALRARLATLPAEARTRAGHLGVLAAIAAFQDGQPWLRELLAHLDRNRRRLAELLATHLPGVGYVPP
jgi:histidinol-phosphate/aromatic aminotransferase/cobyric acid decarboxylase-like protein